MDEWPNWLFFLVRLMVASAVWGVFFAAGWWFSDGKVIGAVGFSLLAVPAVAVALAKPIVLLTEEGFSWLWRQPLERYQGSYYAFNECQIRIYELDDELWFAVPDVLKSVGMKAVPDAYLAIYPGSCRTLGPLRLVAMNPKALEGLLGKRNEHEAIRFMQWMRREVLKPWERKRERA